MIFLLLALFSPLAHAGTTATATPPALREPVASVEDAETDESHGAPAEVERGDQHLKLKLPATLLAGDRITTGHGQALEIKLRDGSNILLAQDSSLRLSHVASVSGEGGTETSLDRGLGHFVVKKVYTTTHPFKVTTPAATLGVRGTEFLAEDSAEEGSNLHVFEGRVAMTSKAEPASEVLVPAGMSSALARSQRTPSKPHPIDFEKLEAHLKTRANHLSRKVRAFKLKKAAVTENPRPAEEQKSRQKRKRREDEETTSDAATLRNRVRHPRSGRR